MFQLRRHLLSRGGKVAPQSPLEESATTSARWHGNVQLPFRIPGKTPFLSHLFFSENTNEFCSKSVQKAARKKLNKHADKQTDLADLEQLWDHVLDIKNADTSRKYLKKLSPK